MVKTIDRDLTNERRNEIKHEIYINDLQTKTTEEIHEFLLKLEEHIGLTRKGDSYMPLRIGFDLFCRNVEKDDNGLPVVFDTDIINENHRQKQKLLVALFHRVSDEPDMLPDINGDETKMVDRVKRLIVMYNDAYDQVILYIRQNTRINFPTVSVAASDSMYRCNTMDVDDEELTSFQKVLLYLLNNASNLEIKRYKGKCYQQIGNTRAWKPIMTITDYVYLYTQKESKYDMWKNLTSKGTMVKDTVNFLTHCKDVQFPEIVKNRNVWSFKNGLFIGKEWDGEKYTCSFYPYESQEFASLDPTIVACKYFDQEFSMYDTLQDWYDIPTPNMQTILDYQEFSEDVCRWMYVMAGRLMYEVNDLDQWQIVPFFKGIARSGKSTLIVKVFKKFYESEDVKILSNNSERKFGLSSIYDGFIFISPEVKGDICLEQAEFQSIVSGEDVSIARKYDTALSTQWKTPGVFAGNEVPGWKDNSGSVIRRFLPFNFSKQVQEADPKLDEKLNDEIPAIMIKCVRAYLEYTRRFANKDIWNVVPKYFKEIQNQIAMVTNSLQHFMSSEKIRYGDDLACPQKLFVQLFNQHCQENNLGRYKFNPDFYAGPFSTRHITVITENRTYNGKPYVLQPFIHGLDIVQDEGGQPDFSDDY